MITLRIDRLQLALTFAVIAVHVTRVRVVERLNRGAELGERSAVVWESTISSQDVQHARLGEERDAGLDLK